MSRAPRYAIRVIDGGMAGVVFPVEERLDIGRSAGADVQLLEGGVSRAHAAIIVEHNGQCTLVDLLSKSGTFAGDERITRYPLTDGDQFRIGTTEFVFEEYSGQVDAELPPVVGDRRAYQPTKLRLPKSEPESPPNLLCATAPDGTRYPGNLLMDIIMFRSMRTTIVREGSLPTALQRRYDRVAPRLHHPISDTKESLSFIRFDCEFGGALKFEDNMQAVWLWDIAVDGVRLSAPSPRCKVDDLCLLSLPVVASEGAQSVVFTSRVVWIREKELGLMFWGTPKFALPDKERSEQKTQPQRVIRFRK